MTVDNPWKPKAANTCATLAALLVIIATSMGCSGGSSNSPATFTAPNSFDERAVLICPFYLACTPNEPDPLTVSDCFRKFVDDDDATFLGYEHEREQRKLVDCLSNATTCADYDRCIAGDNPATCSDDDHCEGDTLVQCVTLSDGSSARVEKHCADQGLTCVGSSAGGAHCGLADAACPDSELSCSGDFMLTCPLDYQEVPFVTNCARQGLSCQSPGLCAPPNAASCSGATCDGARAIHCLDGTPAVADCTKLDPDFTCIPQGSDVTCGLPESQQECDNQPPYSSCNGDVATVCHDHKRFQVDCAKVGASCIENDVGATCAMAN